MNSSFKLSNDFRMAFKQKLENRLHVIKQEPLSFNIKQEQQPLQENRPIKQECIKIEPTTEPFIPMNWFHTEPKHEIIIPKLEDKRPVSRNGYKFNSHQSKLLPPKKKRPQQNRRPQIEIAIRVHENLSSKDPNSLTQRQLDSLTWAETVIVSRALPRHERQRPPAAPPAGPIEIQDDTPTNDLLNQAFIHNETIHVIPDTLQLAVINSANSGGRYSLAQARLIEKTLSKAVINYILENPRAKLPVFGKSVYFDGVLVLDCKDEESYHFAKLILSDIKLWEGSRLKMVEPEKTPFNSIGTLHIPDVGIDKNLVLDVLKAQNPSVNMSNWKMLGETQFTGGQRQYSIMMSNPPIYYQRHKQLRLYFGGSEVILKHFGCEWLWNCKV